MFVVKPDWVWISDSKQQNLTSYSGLILFQHFFSLIGIKERLWRCFRHMKAIPIDGHHVMVMLLVVHLIIGHRRLRDVDYYRDDEMVKRVLGLKRLPDVSTVSRSLASADAQSVGKVRVESSTVVMERLVAERFASVTLDFDGSVLSTGRHAEGTAVGFNKKKKGARSYYPLFCTVAQTDQVLDVHHWPGNVHDSNGADTFIGALCAYRAREPASGKDRGPYRQRVLQPSHRRSTSLLGGQVHHLGAVRALCRSQRNGRRQTTMASHGGRARLFRDPVEAEVVEHPLSLHLHQKTPHDARTKLPFNSICFSPSNMDTSSRSS